jgi:hypothetical protein
MAPQLVSKRDCASILSTIDDIRAFLPANNAAGIYLWRLANSQCLASRNRAVTARDDRGAAAPLLLFAYGISLRGQKVFHVNGDRLASLAAPGLCCGDLDVFAERAKDL